MKPRQPPRTIGSRGGANSSRSAVRPGRCGETSDRTSAPQTAEVFLLSDEKEDRMSVESLKCKECGATYELGATTSARTASARSRSPTTTRRSTPAEAKRRIQAGSQGIWRYADFLPFEGRPGDPLEPGPDAAAARRPARRAARPRRRALDQERRRQPDPLLQGPGRRGRRRQGPELGFDDRRLRLDRQPRQRRRRPRRRRRARVLRLRPRQPRGAEAARDRRLRHQPGRRARQLRRRQPALHAARRNAALGLRQRQPAPLLRRGLEDARLRDGRAARLGAARPGRLPDRLGLALHQARPRLPGVARPRPGRGRAADLQRRPGARAAARSRPPSPKAGTSASRRSRRRSPRAWRSATRPTAPTRSSRRAAPAARSTRSPTRRSATAIRLLAETTGIFTETAGGVTIGVLRKLAERGEIGAGERVVVYITGEGLKTLDATRDRFQHARDRPRPRELRVRVPPGGSRLMAVTVKIPTQLRAATGGEAEVEVSGSTVGEVLDAVFEAHGDLRERITQDGDLRRFVNVYVTGEDIRFQQGLADADRRRRRGHDPARAPSPAAELDEATGRHPLRRPRDAAAGADRDGAEGAGRDRRPADPLARDRDLRGAGLRALPARHRLPGRDGRGVRRRRGLARRRRGRVRRHRARHADRGADRAARRAARRRDLLRHLRRRRRRRRPRRPARLPPRPRRAGDDDRGAPAPAVGGGRARRRRPGRRLRREAAQRALDQRRLLLLRAGRARLPRRGQRAGARAAGSGSPPTGSCAPTATRASGTAWTPTRTRSSSTTSGPPARRRGEPGTPAGAAP